MFSLVGNMDLKQTQEAIGFNTDTVLDLMTGDFQRGVDGHWYCRGGYSPAMAGLLGRQGCYKSTLAVSMAMRMCSIYQTELTIFDSEGSISRSKERILKTAGEHFGVLDEGNIITLDAKNHYDLESMRDLISEIGNKKKEMGKDAMLTTPFIDKDGERVKVQRPTIIFIDSWTECAGNAEKEKIEAKGFDDPSTQTLAMKDANLKTQMTRVFSRYADDFGMELMTTAHYGSKVNMDPYAPNPKAGQWMNQNEAPKAVGGKWMFLTSPLLRVLSCTKLQDDSKSAKYKLGENTNAVDLNEVIVIVDRCKNNASGLSHPFVVSQAEGLLNDCTDYAYLRNVGKGFSMTGNNITHQPFGMPKTNLTRNSFRQVCRDDPRVRRALQLGAQWLYICNNWNSTGWDFPIKIDPAKLVDVLMSDKNKYSIDRVLNSRGYWLPDELTTKETKEYMSIIDVLEFFSHSGVTK